MSETITTTFFSGTNYAVLKISKSVDNFKEVKGFIIIHTGELNLYELNDSFNRISGESGRNNDLPIKILKVPSSLISKIAKS